MGEVIKQTKPMGCVYVEGCVCVCGGGGVFAHTKMPILVKSPIPTATAKSLNSSVCSMENKF